MSSPEFPQVFDSSPMGKSVNATAMSALFDIGDDDGPTFKATVPRGMQTVVETLKCEALVTRNLD